MFAFARGKDGTCVLGNAWAGPVCVEDPCTDLNAEEDRGRGLNAEEDRGRGLNAEEDRGRGLNAEEDRGAGEDLSAGED